MPRGRPEEPVDADAGPLERLAYDLRQLRHSAGSPSYEQLAERAHYSRSTLAAAASGRDLPSLEVTLAYVRACGGKTAGWERRWHEVAAHLAGARGAVAQVSASEAGGAATPPPAGPKTPGPPRHDFSASVAGARGWLARAWRGWRGVVYTAVAAALLIIAFIQATGDRSQRPSAAPTSPATASAGSGPTQPRATSANPPPGGLVVGPGCPTDTHRDILADKESSDGWTNDTGGWTGDGCSGATTYSHLANQPDVYEWQDGFYWKFRTGVTGPARCTLSIHIPHTPHAAGVATYHLYETDKVTGPGFVVFTIDQTTGQGTWTTEPPVAVPNARDLELALVDSGHGTYTIAADAISATCTAS